MHTSFNVYTISRFYCRYISKSLPSTDEASAIGFLYESAILNHLSGAYQKCSKNHQISVFSLPVLVRSPSRFAPEAEVELSKNMLWATPKQERAIDAVTLCENVLVLIQVSIQKTHHKQKLEKLIHACQQRKCRIMCAYPIHR